MPTWSCSLRCACSVCSASSSSASNANTTAAVHLQFALAACKCKTSYLLCRHGAAAAVGFVPTGWTYQTKTQSFPVHEKPPWRVHLIPYSEHSSFTELQEFVGFLRPRKVIPTVGVSGDRGDANAHKLASYFSHLCDNSGALRSFLGPMMSKAGHAASGDVKPVLEEPPIDKAARGVVDPAGDNGVLQAAFRDGHEALTTSEAPAPPPADVQKLSASGGVDVGSGSMATGSVANGSGPRQPHHTNVSLSHRPQRQSGWLES